MRTNMIILLITVGILAGASHRSTSAQTPSIESRPSFIRVQDQGGGQNGPRLRQVIADLRTGSPDMKQFEPFLSVAIEQQKLRVQQYLQMAGKLTNLKYVGPQNGGEVYQAQFENAVSAWWIQISPGGKIAGLYFQ
jgi:hypothetical protein